MLHFTLVSILKSGYYFPYIYWEECVNSVSCDIGSCRMMFIECKLLVCLLITARTNQVGEYNT